MNPTTLQLFFALMTFITTACILAAFASRGAR